MFNLPKISEFYYQGRNKTRPIRRIAIITGDDLRAPRMVKANQLYPEHGIKSFKLDDMIERKDWGTLRTVVYVLRTKLDI